MIKRIRQNLFSICSILFLTPVWLISDDTMNENILYGTLS